MKAREIDAVLRMMRAGDSMASLMLERGGSWHAEHVHRGRLEKCRAPFCEEIRSVHKRWVAARRLMSRRLP